jgi:hypothetical protein
MSKDVKKYIPLHFCSILVSTHPNDTSDHHINDDLPCPTDALCRKNLVPLPSIPDGKHPFFPTPHLSPLEVFVPTPGNSSARHLVLVPFVFRFPPFPSLLAQFLWHLDGQDPETKYKKLEESPQ